MVRRSLGAMLWSLVGLLSCFLGALAALLGTGAGRTLLARSLAGTLERAIAGRVEVGDIGGSLFSGVTLTDVRLFDDHESLVAWLPRAELAYNPFELAAGRVVFQEVRLEGPHFNFEQHANGRLNLEELLRLGRTDSAAGPRGPKPLILLRNVHVTGGTLVLRLQDRVSPGDSLLEIEEVPGGRRRVRRFDDVNLRLDALRLSAPRTRGIRADITSLAARISDPGMTLRDVAGHVTVVGDSLEMDLERVSMPGSQLAIVGRLTWPRGPILYDLDVVADSAALGDFTWIDPRFPPDAELRGAVGVRSSARGQILTVRLDPLRINYHGGVLTGKVTAISRADSGIVRLRDGDLSADSVDLELARPFLDTLPFAGRLSGQTIVAGPMDSLALAADWWFRDSLPGGWPESRIMGSGAVNLRHPEGLAFRRFELQHGRIDLRTAHQLVPALILRGVIDGIGTLEGPYANAEFNGILRHQDGDRPASQLQGRLRLDARGDTLAVSADLTADTLAMLGLRGSYPELPVEATLTGPIRLEGSIADLLTHADLEALQDGGRVRVDGRLTLLVPPTGARALRLTASDVDLRRWFGREAPSARLTFTAEGDIMVDSGVPPRGALRAHLAPSSLAGSAIDSAVAVVRFTDGRLAVDTLLVRLGGLTATGNGALGWRAPASGRLEINVDADSLRVLDSLVSWLAGREALDPADTVNALQGTAQVRATLEGSLDSLAVDARAEVRDGRWREWSLPNARGTARWQPALAQVAVDVQADSVALGATGFGAARVQLAGARDSLSWFARSRVGDWLAFLGGGEVRRDSVGTTARVDSAAFLLPGEIWRLEHPAHLRLTSGTLTFGERGVDFTSADERGRLQLSGSLPLEGFGNAQLTVREFPMAALLALAMNDTTGARGRLNADIAMRGTRRDPAFEGSYVLSGGLESGLQPLVGRGSIAYRNRRLDVSLRGFRGERRILDATAHLPLDLALVPVERRRLSDTLSVRVVADSVDLAQLGLLEAVTSGVRGRFFADLGMRGRWDAPALTGRAELRDAGATIRALNVTYEDLTGRFSFAGDTIRVDSLGLRSGPGRLNVSGFVRLEDLTRPLMSLELDAQEFKALEIRNFMTVTASGKLSLRGPLIGATLTGQGTVTSGVLYFADLVNKRVVNLDEPWVQTLIGPDELRQPFLESGLHNRILDSLRVRNLNLAMGNDVWLRSTEANIQLTGNVTVGKEGPNYVLSGTLQAPRGTYRLMVGVTREFVVTEGTVRYFGTPDLNAELDIHARHVVHPVSRERSEDITVLANIGGTLLVPKLTLSVEDRELSQTEIISYLMFGRSSFELAGNDAALGGRNQAVLQSALAGAVSALSGELERTLVSDLGVPLDYVEIRTGDPADPLSSALFAAGVQIGERTFLTLSAGFCRERQVELSNTIGATLQFRISPEWRTEASFEPVRTCLPISDASNTPKQWQLGLDLFWERRY